MAIEGWYYLHENGELIYKPGSDSIMDIRDSNFAKSAWPCDPADREQAWSTLVEAAALGAKKARIDEVADKWGCNDADAVNYAARVGCVIKMDGNAWCAHDNGFVDLVQSEAGFGDSALWAMADLCDKLGYTGGKMWTRTFKDILAP